MNDHMGNFNRGVGTIRKNQIKMLEVKTTVTKIKSDFKRLLVNLTQLITNLRIGQ